MPLDFEEKSFGPLRSVDGRSALTACGFVSVGQVRFRTAGTRGMICQKISEISQSVNPMLSYTGNLGRRLLLQENLYTTLYGEDSDIL